jgi:membrane-bound lytic murein transglycosylase D
LPGRWGGTGDIPAELRSPETTQKTASPPPAPDSEWLRSLKLPELPVRWDPQVLRYLDYFKNDPKGRQVMSNWIRRAGRFRELFEASFVRHGIPKDLFYVAMIESGFDTGARSRVGAGGVWQFMPGAARAYGLEVSYWVDARRDPERAVDAAARHLKDLFVRFGSWDLAFAAYNAGYGAVLKSITRYNSNDFWELVRHEAGLPWESSIYVPKILAAAIVGHNLDAFGFTEVTADAAFTFDRVEAPPATPLAVVARAAGARLDVIQTLNPHLVRDRTPPDRGVTAVRVPSGTAAAYTDALPAARGNAERLDTVVLRFGETIDELARARGVAPRELRKLNGVRDSSEARAGVALLVPRREGKDQGKDQGKEKDGKAAASAEDGAEREAADEGDVTIVAVPDRVFTYEGRERVFYRTRDGDSLDEIADAFGVRADDLCEWNNVDGSAKVQPNMVFQVYVRKEFDPAGILLLDSARVRVVTLGSEEFLELEAARRGKKRLFYMCKTGDTLAKVGRRYGLTPGDLARINRFSYNTDLRDGQRIVVYSPTGDGAREVSMGMALASKRPKGSAAAAVSTSAKTSAKAAVTRPVVKTVAKAGPTTATKASATTGAKAGPAGPPTGGKTIAAQATAAHDQKSGARPTSAVVKPGASGSGGGSGPKKK